MSKTRALYLILLSSLIASTFTTILYGSPQFPDTWIQLRIAKSALHTSHLSVWDSYDTNWPLVNLMLVLASYITGLDPPLVVYLLLIMVTGLSILPLYMIIHYKDKLTIYSMLLLIGLSFEPMYLSLISSFQKEAAPLIILNSLLMIIVVNKRMYPLIILFTIGILLGHHFLSLYVVLLFISMLLYDFISSLKRGEKQYLSPKILVPVIILSIVYQYMVGLRFVREYEYYRFSQSDLVVLTGFFVLSFMLIYGRRKETVRKITQLIVFATILTLYASIRYLGLFGFNLPRPSPIELLVVLGYMLLLFNSLRIKDPGLDRAIIPAVALALYGITLEPVYGGVTILVKAMRRIIPLLSLQSALKPVKIVSVLFLLAMLLAFFAHVKGYTVFGGPALYEHSEINDAKTISVFLNGTKVRCSWRTEVLLKYYNPSVNTIGLLNNDDALLVISSAEKSKGLITRVWYNYVTVDMIDRGRNLVYNSGVFYIYR